MKLFVGDYEVMESGTVVGIYGQPVSFHIENLIYTFEFITDAAQPKLTLKTEVVSNTHLKVIFYNFDDTLGAGNIAPIKFGNIGDRDLYFQYRIYTLRGDSGKLLHYTWLLSKKNEGGENGKEGK